MFYHAKNRTIIIENTEMDYVTFGKGDKTLVMIPGLNTRGVKGAAVSLAYMYRIFAEEYQCFVFDRKKQIPDGYTVRDMAADIATAMSMLDIVNADVFGVSQGGMIAQYLAMDFPQLVNKLVLGVTLSKNNDAVQEVVKNWIALSQQVNYKELTKDMVEKMYSAAYIKKYKGMIPLLALLNKPKDPVRFRRMAEACLTCETYDELDKIKCPVFVLGGAQDKVVTGRASEEIAEKLNCDLFMYPDLGHAAYEEANDFNGRILDFLKK